MSTTVSVEPPDVSESVAAAPKPAKQGNAFAAVNSIISNILVVGINICNGSIVSHTLKPYGRGELSSITLWQSLLSTLLAFGIPSALIYNVNKYRDRASEIYGAALALGLFSGCLAALVGFIGIPYWLSNYSAESIHTARILNLTCIFATTALLTQNVMLAYGDFKLVNGRRIGVAVCTIIGLLCLLLVHRLTPFTAAWVYILPGLLLPFPVIVKSIHTVGIKFTNFTKSAGLLISYGMRSYGVDVLSVISSQVDQVLVVQKLDPTHMGLYTTALNLSRFSNIMQAGISQIILPKGAGRAPEEVLELTEKACRISMVLTIIIALCIIAFAPFAISLLYGKDFLPALNAFRFLIIEACFAGVTSIINQSLMALGRPGTVTILQGIGLSLAIPLLIILIPRYGIAGAGCAIMCSTITRFILVMFCYPVLLKMRMPSLWWKKSDIEWAAGLIKNRRYTMGKS